MDQHDLEIEGTTFHLRGLVTWEKEKFIATYRDLVAFNLDQAWDRIQTALGHHKLKKPYVKPKNLKKPRV